ncbi:2'-5' RNA ligase family protein [Pseudarthrobacter sp. C4D7]|uniref:2'-5' RNA ligase family protein n=1 Tax=Pseudarthrobacter sp. C4D7 TaxID=2735268 RepID=UPI0015851B99|nr:2'-5' RNA ligase family protein [Pseudarthrobacter sp. C4D7]NUT71443.1 2'-5' RNA ligase family protein [Pseudarthrobacter sp. C4D7]
MRSIELVFDSSTDALVRADWARLEAAGLPSLAAHTSPSNSPHITLAAGLDLQAAQEGPWQMLPVDVVFSGAIVFPAGAGRYVLARSVLLTPGLLDLHATLHRDLGGALPLTLPGAWTPHVTISRRIPGHQLGAAMDLLDLRVEGSCTAARLWDSSTKTVTLLGGAAWEGRPEPRPTG